MWKEFKQFLQRGNVIDLAVAVVVGAAFGAIVNSFVNDILMPPIGLLLGGVDFANLFVDLSGEGHASLADAQAAGAATINYGLFLNSIITFVIVAFAICLLVKAITTLTPTKEEAPAEPTTRECPYCYTTIAIKATRFPHCTSQL